jgi:pyruvate dehydrogenase E2 component (dihydrolipoamide acetyltransferase)
MQPAPAQDAGEHEKASPIVRRMAREQGIDLAQLQGSGPDGRITQEDLQLYVAGRQGKPKMAPAPATGPVVAETTTAAQAKETAADRGIASSMRQAIAATVSRSWREIPHFSVTAELNMSTCRGIVSELKGGQQRIGYHALIVKACAAALELFPQLHTTGGASAGGINISFAVALPEGLLMPVIRDCQGLSLVEIERETSRLAEKSRAGKLSAGEMSGGGFSVSNLGMYGVDEFTALILPGQTATLAVGAVVERPVVREGQMVVAPTMRVTLSCDHRAIDGAYAASFLAELRRLLEHPLSLLIRGQPVAAGAGLE